MNKTVRRPGYLHFSEKIFWEKGWIFLLDENVQALVFFGNPKPDAL
jgi:hypothetical protein